MIIDGPDNEADYIINIKKRRKLYGLKQEEDRLHAQGYLTNENGLHCFKSEKPETDPMKDGPASLPFLFEVIYTSQHGSKF